MIIGKRSCAGKKLRDDSTFLLSMKNRLVRSCSSKKITTVCWLKSLDREKSMVDFEANLKRRRLHQCSKSFEERTMAVVEFGTQHYNI